MPRLLGGIDSIFDLEDRLLDSGGCCDFGGGVLASGLAEIQNPTPSEILSAEMAKTNILVNISKRIFRAIQDPEITIDSFVFFAKIVKNNKMSIDTHPGLVVAMFNKLEELSLNTDSTARQLLLLEKAEEFMLDASAPSICLSELTRNSYINTHTFEDYGQIILETI
jgi:hypothetical protein